MNTKRLVTSGIMIGLAVVLSMIKMFEAPYGGSVTAASMVPIIIIALIYKPSWGIISAGTYALLQMALGFMPPPAQDVISFALVILLDYIIAFGALGLAGIFAKPFPNKVIGYSAATLAVCVLRFLCHFVSGIMIWGVYAPEGQSPTLYSLLYNGSYMLIECIITIIVISAISTFIENKQIS